MRRWFLLTAFTAVFFVLVPSIVAALCLTRSDMITALANNSDEQPVAVGKTFDGVFLEVYASPNGKSWTILINNLDGTACLLSSGGDWIRTEFPELEKPKT